MKQNRNWRTKTTYRSLICEEESYIRGRELSCPRLYTQPRVACSHDYCSHITPSKHRHSKGWEISIPHGESRGFPWGYTTVPLALLSSPAYSFPLHHGWWSECDSMVNFWPTHLCPRVSFPGGTSLVGMWEDRRAATKAKSVPYNSYCTPGCVPERCWHSTHHETSPSGMRGR